MDQTKGLTPDMIGGERIGDLRFADDMALLAERKKGLGLLLQKTLTGVAKVSKKWA